MVTLFIKTVQNNKQTASLQRRLGFKADMNVQNVRVGKLRAFYKRKHLERGKLTFYFIIYQEVGCFIKISA